MAHLPEPHEEALGAALIAMRHARLPWYARMALRRHGKAESAIARETARRVEHRTRLLCAREIDTLDDPAWAEAIGTAKQLILAKPAGGLLDEWWKRLPAFSGATPETPCRKCGATGYGAAASFVRHLVRPAGCDSPAVFGELLVRTCGRCGFEWRERCADAQDAQNGPQGDDPGSGDARDAEAGNKALSASEETGTAHSSPERPEDAHSGTQAPDEASGLSETRDGGKGARGAAAGREEATL